MVAGLAVAWTVRQRRETPPGLVVTGTIEATQIDISPRITARIVERTVREGHPSSAGSCSCGSTTSSSPRS